MLFRTPFKSAAELGLSEKTREALIGALAFLDGDVHPKGRFDMSCWGWCIRGWAETLLDGKFTIQDYPPILHKLFIPSGKRLKEITKAEAGDALRNYLLTGEVVWS